MTRWQAIGRPMVAYCAAVLAASAVFLVIPVAVWVAATFGDSPPAPGSLVSIAKMGGVLAIAIATTALIPTLIALLLLRDCRSPRGLAHAVAGGVIGFCMCALPLAASTHFGPGVTTIFVLLVPAGLVGGYVYWRTNGRPGTQERHRVPALSEGRK